MTYCAKPMSRIIKKITNQLDKMEALTSLLTRLVLGWVFLFAGLGKLQDLDHVIEFFASLGIPMASIQAPLIATLEFIGGGLLILGFGTRLISFLLSCTMMVALMTAHREDITSLGDIFKIYEFGYALLFFFLITRGAGWISLDYFIKRRCERDLR